MHDADDVTISAALTGLSKQLEAQTSVWYALRNGIIYGMGFVIGSTILTALIVTFGFTFFGNTVFGDVIAWIIATN